MKNLAKTIALFLTFLSLPLILYANSGNRPIPDELLEISCYNTQCSTKTFSSIKKMYEQQTNCGYKFKGSLRWRIALKNLIDFHFQNYLENIRSYCKTGILPERKIIESTPWGFYILMTFGVGIILYLGFTGIKWLLGLVNPPTK